MSKDGSKVSYHLAKSLTKDGVIALFSFTLLDLDATKEQLNPIVSTATKTPAKAAEVSDVVRVITGEHYAL